MEQPPALKTIIAEGPISAAWQGLDATPNGAVLTSAEQNPPFYSALSLTPPVNNQILSNTFSNTGSGQPGDADIAIDGTGINNCIDHNTRRTAGSSKPATVDPPNPVGLSDCGNSNPLRANAGRGVYTPGDPVVSVMAALNAAGITEKKDYKGPGPHPEAQQTMANPCAGAPANPWCVDGRPVIAPPSSPGR